MFNVGDRILYDNCPATINYGNYILKSLDNTEGLIYTGPMFKES